MDEKQYTELAVKVQEIDSRSRSNEHRIDELDTQQNDSDSPNEIENFG